MSEFAPFCYLKLNLPYILVIFHVLSLVFWLGPDFSIHYTFKDICLLEFIYQNYSNYLL